jgi:ribosomal protein S26
MTQTRFTNDEGKVIRDSLGHTSCVNCGKVVSVSVEKFSLGHYNNVYCFDCQKKVGDKNVYK